MPGHERRIVGLLDEEVRGPAEQIRAVQILDGIDDAVVAHEVAEPREEQVRLVAQRPLERATVFRLERFEPSPDLERFGFRHHAHGKDASVAPELVDLGWGEDLGHGSSFEPNTRCRDDFMTSR